MSDTCIYISRPRSPAGPAPAPPAAASESSACVCETPLSPCVCDGGVSSPAGPAPARLGSPGLPAAPKQPEGPLRSDLDLGPLA